MTKTSTTVAVVVVIALVLVLVVMSQRPRTPVTNQNQGASSYLGPLFSLGAAVVTAASVRPPSQNTSSAPSVPAGFDTSNYTTSSGYQYTDENGNFVAG